MRIDRKLFALLGALLLVIVGITSAQSNPIPWMQGGKEVYLVKKADNFIILYDRSESMARPYNNTVMTKLQAERKILLEKNATLPDMNWQAGIYSFSPALNLGKIISFYPMQMYDKKKFSNTLIGMPLEPKGATMLQQGIFELDTILSQMPGKTVVFTFTDGLYTYVDTLARPGEIASKLGQKYDVCFAVMSSAEEPAAISTVSSIASATPCSYQVQLSELLGNPEWMTNALFEIVEKKPETKEMITGYVWQNIMFDFDKAVVKPEYHATLAKAGTYLRAHPQARVLLEGHTDSIGSKEYNLKLSHRRAAAVRDYLINNERIDASRITLSGFGFSKPIATNDTSEGRALNRRVQGIITGME